MHRRLSFSWTGHSVCIDNSILRPVQMLLKRCNLRRFTMAGKQRTTLALNYFPISEPCDYSGNRFLQLHAACVCILHNPSKLLHHATNTLKPGGLLGLSVGICAAQNYLTNQHGAQEQANKANSPDTRPTTCLQPDGSIKTFCFF